jgi:cohesin loading factor subunit SCC2
MAHPPRGSQDRLTNGVVASQSGLSKVAPARFDRPFTLPEALPYTPFTTITAFDPGKLRLAVNGRIGMLQLNLICAAIIPIPTLGNGSLAPPVLDLVSKDDFDSLNKEVQEAPMGAQRLEQSLATMQHLLDPKRIPQLYVN